MSPTQLLKALYWASNTTDPNNLFRFFFHEASTTASDEALNNIIAMTRKIPLHYALWFVLGFSVLSGKITAIVLHTSSTA